MASQLPVDYYENEANHGTYVYETLENLVNNFMQAYTGDDKLLGNVTRRNVLLWMKKGIQQFTFDALREVRVVELELNDTLTVTLPPDFVNMVRLSWLDQHTGQYRPIAENRHISLGTSYLQDHEAQILFDADGYILEGTMATEVLNERTLFTGCTSCGSCESVCCDERQLWSLDTSKNYNGSYNIDTRQGRIKFSSDNLTRVIILEYISDGLQYTLESDIRVNKLAEYALYQWTNWNLLSNKMGVPDYEKRRAKREYDTAFRNTKVRMGDSIAELAQLIKENRRWIR